MCSPSTIKLKKVSQQKEYKEKWVEKTKQKKRYCQRECYNEVFSMYMKFMTSEEAFEKSLEPERKERRMAEWLRAVVEEADRNTKQQALTKKQRAKYDAVVERLLEKPRIRPQRRIHIQLQKAVKNTIKVMAKMRFPTSSHLA